MNKTILVIDDGAMNLRMAEFILTKENYKVWKADSGREGIEILKREAVDLTLLDIEMPEMNGIETLKRIREDVAIRESKVMVLTATITDAVKEQMDALGVLGYIGKPFMPADLQTRVAEALCEGKLMQ